MIAPHCVVFRAVAHFVIRGPNTTAADVFRFDKIQWRLWCKPFAGIRWRVNTKDKRKHKRNTFRGISFYLKFYCCADVRYVRRLLWLWPIKDSQLQQFDHIKTPWDWDAFDENALLLFLLNTAASLLSSHDAQLCVIAIDSQLMGTFAFTHPCWLLHTWKET